jgi:protein-disulfide isomerase
MTSRSSLQRDGVGSSVKFAAALIVAIFSVCILLRPTEVFAKGDALAEVDGEAITPDEIAKVIGTSLGRLEEQIYTLKRRTLDALIADKLLSKEAAKRGMSVQGLLEAETQNVEPVTEQEIEVTYRQQKAQLKGDETTAKEQLRQQLQAQRIAARQRVFVNQLRTQSVVVVNLKPPTAFRVAPNIEGAPFKGSAAAPVTIVEFQDFHCPFCQRVQPTLIQLAGRYGNRVKFVYRDFPIDSLHPHAREAHEAARCANAREGSGRITMRFTRSRQGPASLALRQSRQRPTSRWRLSNVALTPGLTDQRYRTTSTKGLDLA